MSYFIEIVINYFLIGLEKFGDVFVSVVNFFVQLTYAGFWITLVLSPFIGVAPALIFGLLSLVFITLT